MTREEIEKIFNSTISKNEIAQIYNGGAEASPVVSTPVSSPVVSTPKSEEVPALNKPSLRNADGTVNRRNFAINNQMLKNSNAQRQAVQNKVNANIEAKRQANLNQRKQAEDEFNNAMGEYAKSMAGGRRLGNKDLENQIKQTYGLSDKEFKDAYYNYTSGVTAKASNEFANNAGNFADKHKVLGTLASTGLNVLASGEGVTNTLKGFMGKDISDGDHFFSNARDKMREEISNEFNKTGQTIYNVGTGLGDMAVNMGIGALTGNPGAVSGFVNFGNTASRNQQQALDNGSDLSKATLYGLLTGATEGAMSAGVADKIYGGAKAGSSLATQIGRGALNEAGENVAQDVITTIADGLINGGNSEFTHAYKNYMANGMNEADARNTAALDIVKQYGVDAVMGAVMGGGLAGITGSVVNRGNKPTTDTSDIDTFIQNAQDTQAQAIDNLNKINETLEAQRVANEQANNATQNTNTTTQNPQTDTLNNVAEEITTKPISAPKKAYSDKIAKSSQFADLGKSIDKLVGWYDPKKENAELVSQFKQAINEFEDTGDVEVYNRAWEVAEEIHNNLQGKTKTYSDTYTKSGALKRKGETFTYGTTGSIEDAMESFIDTANDIYLSKRNNVDVPGEDINVEVDPNIVEKMNSDTIPALEPMKQNVPQNQNIPSLNRARNGKTIEELDQLSKTYDTSTDLGEDVSQFRTNTVENDRFTTTEEKADYFPEEEFKYAKESELHSYTEAKKIIEQGVDKAKERVMKATGESMSAIDVDTGMLLYRRIIKEARDIEANGGDASGKFAEAFDIMKYLQNNSTESGQALQALVKWTRYNTPEGIMSESIRQAESVYNDIVLNKKRDKGKYSKAEKKAYETLGYKKFIDKENLELSNETLKQIMDLSEEIVDIGGLDADGAQQKLGEISKILIDQMPTSYKEQLTSLLMDNMLGNFRTLISRNLGGNIGFALNEQTLTKATAAGIDKLISKVTGKRTVDGISKEGIKDYLTGFAKGFKDEVNDIKTHTHTLRSGEEFDIGESIKRNKNAFRNSKTIFGKLLYGYDEIVKHGLSAGDRMTYEATYNQKYNELLRNKNKGMYNTSASDEEFDAAAKAIARQVALESVYQDDSFMSEALLGMRDVVGNFSRQVFGIDVMSQFTMPFAKTPGNVIARNMEYTPVGFIKNAVTTAKELKVLPRLANKINAMQGKPTKQIESEFDQRRFVTETARNLVGSGWSTLAGATVGEIITGAFSEDKDQKAAQKEHGYQQFALKFGDYLYDIGFMPTIGSAMTFGAAVSDYMQKHPDESVLSALYKGTLNALADTMDMSSLQNFTSLFGGNQYSDANNFVENAAQVIMKSATQFIMSSVSQTSRVTDPYERDVYGSSLGYAKANFINQIPELNEQLQPRVGNDGELIKRNQGRNWLSRAFENYISPGKLTKMTTDPVYEEANRLFETTKGDTDAYLPTAKVNDEKFENLTDAEKTAYKQTFGKNNTKAAESLMNSEWYNSLTDTEKASAMNGMYKAMKEVSLSEHIKDYEVTDRVAKAYLENGMDGAIEEAKKKYIFKGLEADMDSTRNNNAYDYFGEDGVALQKKYTTYMDTNKNGSAKKRTLSFVDSNIKNKADAGFFLFNNSKDSKALTRAYNAGGYECVYDFYTNFVGADKDGNGSLKKKYEVIPYLESKYQNQNDRKYWYDILIGDDKNPY